jgi:hypothetical protein
VYQNLIDNLLAFKDNLDKRDGHGFQSQSTINALKTDIDFDINELTRKQAAADARLGQLHVWVAEARSAKIGFAEYIASKVEQEWFN